MSGFHRDPSDCLRRVFDAILDQRMAGVPILNPTLRVEAVGFTLTSSGWMGVLVTPWFMNIVLLPAAGRPWQRLPVGEKRRVALPASTLEFFGGHEEGLGEYHYCSMFSPMEAFADHESARATATEIARMLFDPAVGEEVRRMNPIGLKWFEAAPATRPEAEPVSPGKRKLLFRGEATGR